MGDWPDAPVLRTAHLFLEPLRVDHAGEMASLLGDPGLYVVSAEGPATFAERWGRYRRQALGRSIDGAQRWFNWVVCLEQSGEAVGIVQATVSEPLHRSVADLAWVIAVAHQRRGYAREAATAMAKWLREHGAGVLAANIHPRNEASMQVARVLGLAPTDQIIDGEVRWVVATV